MIGMLYSTVGIIVAVGYLPQIYKLLISKAPCRDISLVAWTVWEYTAIVSLLYSLYGQESLDTKFVLVNAINVVCITMIIIITIYKRRKYGDIVTISEDDDSLTNIYNTVEQVEEIIETAEN